MEHVVVAVSRGENVESLHEGFVAVVDQDGSPKAGFGNIQYATFLRSSAKPFQLYPLLLKGGVERFNFTPQEITVMCSSHTGQPDHVECVRSILKKIGFDETHLQCGVHPPMYQVEAERTLKEKGSYGVLQNNCSGKHSGMLAQTVLFEYDSKTYLALSNPVQQNILKTISLFSDVPSAELPAGIDGCSAPIYLMPLDKMAESYGRAIYIQNRR